MASPYQPIPPTQPPPRRKLSNGAIIAIVAGATVVLLCGICSIVAVISRAGTPRGGNPAPVVMTPSKAQPTLPALPFGPPTTPPATQVTVPDGLVGGNAKIVEGKLMEAGFTNISFGTNDPGDSFVILLQNWRVTKVEPGSGTKMMSDQPVVVTCTKL